MARPDVSSSAANVALARVHLTWLGVVDGPFARQMLPPEPATMASALQLPGWSVPNSCQPPSGHMWTNKHRTVLFGTHSAWCSPRFPVRDAEVGSSNLPHPIGTKACSQALSVVFSPDAVAPRYSFHRAFIAPDGSHEPRALARSLRRHPTPRGRSLWSSAGRGTRRDVLRLARLAVLDHLPNADLTGHAPEVPVLDRRAWARPCRRAGRLVVGAGAKLS